MEAIEVKKIENVLPLELDVLLTLIPEKEFVIEDETFFRPTIEGDLGYSWSFWSRWVVDVQNGHVNFYMEEVQMYCEGEYRRMTIHQINRFEKALKDKTKFIL